MLSPPGACLDIAVTSCVWQESSVEKFGAVHNKLKDVGKDETVRGASLRELQRFFEAHDKDKGYAGLRRIADDDGTVVWTILKETEVAAQLEKRAGERREEERRGEIFSAQARTPSEATDAASNEVETLRAELKVAREEEAKARGEAETARGVAESSAVRSCPSARTPSLLPPPLPVILRELLSHQGALLTAYLVTCKHTQAELQAKLNKKKPRSGCCPWL